MKSEKRDGTVGLFPGGPFQGDFSFTQISLTLDLKDPRRPEDPIAIARSPGSGGTTQEPGSLSGDSGCIWSLEVPVRRMKNSKGCGRFKTRDGPLERRASPRVISCLGGG